MLRSLSCHLDLHCLLKYPVSKTVPYGQVWHACIIAQHVHGFITMHLKFRRWADSGLLLYVPYPLLAKTDFQSRVLYIKHSDIVETDRLSNINSLPDIKIAAINLLMYIWHKN